MARQGQVKFFDWDKKYGFIVDGETKEDVFVHITDIVPRNPEAHVTLYTGEYVSYDLVPSTHKEGTKASQVRGVGGGTLLCDHGMIEYQSYTRCQFPVQDAQVLQAMREAAQAAEERPEDPEPGEVP